MRKQLNYYGHANHGTYHVVERVASLEECVGEDQCICDVEEFKGMPLVRNV